HLSAMMIYRIRPPDERFGIIVGLFEEAMDDGLDLIDRAEDSALQATLSQFGAIAVRLPKPARRTRPRGRQYGNLSSDFITRVTYTRSSQSPNTMIQLARIYQCERPNGAYTAQQPSRAQEIAYHTPRASLANLS